MSNVAATESKANATPNAGAIEEKAKASQQAAQAKGKAEGKAYIAKLVSVLQEGAELGNIALDTIAEELGASGNKLGRPSESAFLAFASAIAHRPGMTFERRNDLAKKCNAKCNPMHKPVAVLKAKGSATQGTASYRFNAPASVEIALS